MNDRKFNFLPTFKHQRLKLNVSAFTHDFGKTPVHEGGIFRHRLSCAFTHSRYASLYPRYYGH